MREPAPHCKPGTHRLYANVVGGLQACQHCGLTALQIRYLEIQPERDAREPEPARP